MPAASVLRRILQPMSVDAFVAGYFQRRPLRIPGTPDKFDFLFREDDFALNLDRVKHIRAVFSENRQARIRPPEIEDMFEAGATICVTGMERANRKLREAARRIRAELAYSGEVTFRAYLSPPGSGFDIHYDARVATTLQIAGTKRWWYSSQPALPFPAHNSGRGPASSRRYRAPPLSSMRTVLLRPGDVLCLPAGVWHCAKGTATTLALNLAFDHNRGSVFDSIINVLHDRLMGTPEWREPLPPVPGAHGGRIPQSVASMLRERIDHLQAELSALRNDEKQLTRAWQMAVQSKRTA